MPSTPEGNSQEGAYVAEEANRAFDILDTPVAVIRSKEAGPSWQAKSFRSKSMATWRRRLAIKPSVVRSTDWKLHPRAFRRGAIAPGPNLGPLRKLLALRSLRA